MNFILGLLVASVMATTSPQVAQDVTRAELTVEVVDKAKIENYVRQEAIKAKLDVEVDLVVKIAKCESGLRQFDSNGRVLRGVVNHKDVGIFQVNEFYHLEESRRLGFDIYSVGGNIQYATWLLKSQGTEPWSWSKKCWKNIDSANEF
jgi:hypothetical protein